MLRNKYRRWYDQIMKRARERGTPDEYFEKHHVKPKALGGSNDKRNIVRLTFREHFLAHWLLIKFVKGQDRKRMLWALTRMCQFTKSRQGASDKGSIISSWQYAVARKNIRDVGHSEETKAKMSKSHMGNPSTKGKKSSKKTKRKISKSLKGNTRSVGRILPDYHIEAIRKGHEKYWEKVRDEVQSGKRKSLAPPISKRHVRALRKGHQEYFEELRRRGVKRKGTPLSDVHFYALMEGGARYQLKRQLEILQATIEKYQK